jgi:phage baseplate assembly protein W
MANEAYYSDIEIELVPQQDGDITRDIDEEAIINSLRNILLTSKGTRRMLPTFATNLDNILFEPIDAKTTGIIRASIIDAVNKWDDRVTIVELYIKPLYDQNAYDCLFHFRIKGWPLSAGTKSVNFILRRI